MNMTVADSFYNLLRVAVFPLILTLTPLAGLGSSTPLIYDMTLLVKTFTM